MVGCRWRRSGVRMRRGGVRVEAWEEAVGALNDASALAVGALETVLDLIALDEGGYQRAHRAHLRRRVPGRVPGGCCTGRSGKVRQVQRCAREWRVARWWRGVAAWGAQRGAAGTIAGGQAGPVRGRLRQASATEPPRCR